MSARTQWLGLIAWVVTLTLIVGNRSSEAADRSTKGSLASYAVEIAGNGERDTRVLFTGGTQRIERAQSTVGGTRGTDQHTHTSGASFVEPLKLGVEVAGNRDYAVSWVQQAIEQGDAHAEVKRNVTVLESDQQGQYTASRTFTNAFPIRYVFPKLHASKDDTLREGLEVLAERVTYNDSDGGGSGNEPNNNTNRGRANAFAVAMDGLGNLAQQLFAVEIDDVVIPALPMQDGQQTSYKTYRPGQPQYGNVTLRFYKNNDIQSLRTVWQDTLNGQDIRKQIIVQVFDASRSNVVRTYTLHDCRPVAYNEGVYGEAGQIGAVEVVMALKIGRVELAAGGNAVASAAGSSQNNRNTGSGHSGSHGGTTTPDTSTTPDSGAPDNTGNPDTGNTDTSNTGNTNTGNANTGTPPSNTQARSYVVTKVTRLPGSNTYRITFGSGRMYDVDRSQIVRIQVLPTAPKPTGRLPVKPGTKPVAASRMYRVTVKPGTRFRPARLAPAKGGLTPSNRAKPSAPPPAQPK